MYELEEYAENWKNTLEAIKNIYNIDTRVINNEIREVNYVIYASDESYLRCVLKRDISKNIGHCHDELLRNQELNITYLENGKFAFKADGIYKSFVYDAFNKCLTA
jgi:hypothetical protein